MLQVGDKVRLKTEILQSFPEWYLEREADNVGTVIEDEHNGWVIVRWTKPRWYDPIKFACVEIAELMAKIESEAKDASI